MAGARIQLKRATASSWSSANPVLYAGEIGYETDTNKFKIGNGSTAYNSLPYFNGNLTGSSLNDLADVTIVSASNGDFLRWNGTAWINDAVNLSTDTVGNYMVDVVSGTGVTVTHTPGEGSTASVAIGQDVATSASVTFAHVNADVTGDVIGDLTGNADTATTLETARTIELSGDVTGSVSFDGSGDVNIVASVASNAVELGVNTTGNYMTDVVGGTGVTVSHTPGEGSSASIAIGQAVGTSSSVTFAHVSASVTGNVVGDVFGNADTATALETPRNIILGGNLSGSASFDGTNDVTITALVPPDTIVLGIQTQGDYIGDVVGLTGVTVQHAYGEGSTASISIGQDVSTSASVTFANLTVSGDLTVNGTTTTLNTQDLLVEDNTIVLNANVTGEPSGTAGIEIERGSLTNVQLRWNETTDSWEITEDGTTYRNIAAGQDVETSSSVTFAAVTAPLIGNASTATTLATARAISLGGDLSGSVSFDGSQDVTITADVQPNSVALGTDTTGNYVNDIVSGTGVTVTHTPGEGSSASIAIGQDVATTASVTFAAVTAPVIGNASTATTLQTARAISLAGDLSGSASFNGSTDITITADVQPNSVALGTDTTGNYVNDVVSGTGVTVTHTPGEGSSASIAIGQDVATTASVTFAAVTAPLVGNANTATALQNARTIELSGDVSGSASFDGTSNINISTTVNTASVSITELSGVNITNPEEFQTLEYDGTQWVNKHASVVSYVQNAEATTLTTGTVVYLFGGTGDHASVKRADNGSDTTSSKTVGVVGASIAASQNGPVITRGYVDGIDLSVGYAPGDILWLGENGAFTKTKPSAPDHLVFIGVVVRATNNGIVYVATQNGYELEELHDVKISDLANNDFLKYNSASGVWVNDPINLGTDTVGNYVNDIVAGTGVTVTHTPGEGSSASIAIGQAVGTSSSVVFARVETTGHLVVGQNLYVSGSVITENQTSLQIDDPFIYLNGSSSVSNVDLGIAGNYNDGTYRHAGIFRDATDGKFKFFDSYEPEPSSPINTGHASYSPAPVVAETFESTIATGSAPFVVASTTEVANLHADTATTLHTSRAISLGGDLSGSASFDGSGDITITASVEPNSVALGTDTTGNYMVGLAEGTGVTIIHTPGEGSTASVSIGQAVGTSDSVTFVNTTLTGALIGNASTTSIATTSATPIYSFAKASYRTTEAIIQVTQGSKYTSLKVMVSHDGTTSYAAQYGLIEIGSPIIPLTISTDISGNDVRILATISNGNSNNATVRVVPTLVAI